MKTLPYAGASSKKAREDVIKISQPPWLREGWIYGRV